MKMGPLHWPSGFCLVLLAAFALIDCDPLPTASVDGAIFGDLQATAWEDANEIGVLNSKLSAEHHGSQAFRSRRRRAAADTGGCAITIDDSEVDGLGNVLRGLVSIYKAQKKQTEEALQALAAQREETKKALEHIEVQKQEIATLQKCAQNQTNPLKASSLEPCRRESLTWSAAIQKGKTSSIISCATNPATVSVVEEHLQFVVISAYGSEPKNMDGVLNFVDQLPTPSLALSAYKALLGALNSTELRKEVVRLIYKMRESSIKFNEAYSSPQPTIRSFLDEKFDPKLLKLVGGEFFNWVGYSGYVYLPTNPRNVDFYQHAARLESSTSEDRKEDKWFWQILPVPGRDGKVFYLRNKLNVNTPVLPTFGVEKNHVRLMPIHPTIRSPINIINFNLWGFYKNDYIDGGGSPSSVGTSLDSGASWIWGAEYP